ncbi:MAG: PAS domain S-box protein [Ignavibacteria bacterium]
MQNLTAELVQYLSEFGESPTTARDIINSVTIPDKRTQVLQKFQTICKTFHFRSARLVDLNGNLIYNYPDSAPAPGKFAKANIKEIAHSKKNFLSDIHKYQDTDIIHLDLYIPILNEGKVLYVVIFEVVPEDKLYPYIKQNLTPFSTVETYLLRRDSNGITFLSNCHPEDTIALKLTIPYNDTGFVAAKAINISGELIAGLDHRKTPVYAMCNHIPSVNWILMSQIDQSELLEASQDFKTIVNLLTLTLILLVGVTLTLIWRHTRTKFYKTLYNLELEKQALEQHFNEAFENAHDAIILCDESGRITNANKQALTLYNYTANQIKNLTVRDLQPYETKAAAVQPGFIDLLDKGRIVESVHIKRDGSTFPVEVSEKYIYVDNHRFLQLIIRDITERRILEEKLKKQLYLFSVLSQINQLIVRAQNLKQLMSQIPAVLTDYGNFPVCCLVTYAQNGSQLETYIHCKTAFTLSQKTLERITQNLLPLSKQSQDILIFNDVLKEPALSDFAETLTTQKLSSIIFMPIVYKHNITASLTVLSHKKDFFTEDDRHLFREIVGDIMFATDALEKEKLLRESELKFRTIFDNANDAIMLLHNYKFIDFNNRTLELFAAQRDDILGKFPYELSPEFQPDGKPSKEAAFEFMNAALHGNRQIFDWTHKKLNGELFICEISLTKISLAGEDYIVAILRDVTEFVEYKNKLEELNLRFNLALASGEIGTFDYDIKNAHLFLDEFSHKMLELEPGSFSGKFEDFLSFVHPDDLPEFSDALKNAMESTSSYFEYEVRLITTRGKVKHKLIRASIFRNEANIPLRAIGISLDITQRKLQELELVEAKAQAETASKIKSNILSSLSHEIRTPLTGILGFAELLKDTLHSQEEREMAELILTSGHRLLNTLTSILNLSRIEADKIEVNKSITDLSECVRQAGLLFVSMAEAKNLKIKFDLKTDVYADIDVNLLHQVLNNLIHNAITYTSSGYIYLRTLKEYKDNISFAVIEIEDTGIGIPEDKLDIIFEPFRQVSEGVDRKFEGSGLGLTLAKGIVEKMNGSITVSSKSGYGSIFRVIFEAIDSPTKKSSQFDNSDISPVKATKKLPDILHIDDDSLTILTVKHFLRNLAITDSAINGFEGIKLAKSKNYDCILLDIGLAGLSGLDTLKEIKKIPHYNNIPIIAVTAYAISGDKEYFLSEGFTHYLAKPFTKKELITFLKEAKVIQ